MKLRAGSKTSPDPSLFYLSYLWLPLYSAPAPCVPVPDLPLTSQPSQA